jgi:hypothetical protein
MPRTTAEAGKDFDYIRHQRALADRLRKEGAIDQSEWQDQQNGMGALDRRYFAEWSTSQNPLSAIPLSGLIPAEYLAKKLRLRTGRSQPDLNSVRQGYLGVGDGIRNYMDSLGRRVVAQPERLP